MKRIVLPLFAGAALLVASCTSSTNPNPNPQDSIVETPAPKLADKYAHFTLTTDLSVLSEKEKQMIPLLIKAADVMDRIFWFETYGEKDAAFALAKTDEEREFVRINYGPWDRLDGDKPFIAGVGAKPLGAGFYPNDMTKEEFEKSPLKEKASLYTMLRRQDGGGMNTLPYHVAFAPEVQEAAGYLKQAAELAEDPGLKNYLNLRAEALLNDEYQKSDLAWMDMKNNTLDLVIGPIETYEDALFGYKAAHEAYVLVKDKTWSAKLAKFAAFLPELQQGLPVEAKYKAEKPGADADLNAYDVIYYAGNCNSSSKTIAINLPNDEQVQLQKGTRRLQLKNAMQAKFDKILVPLANTLIDSTQRKYITFDAFFDNTMFHEVAHGLGIKNTINGKGTVREALKEHASALEEGKADILGLYMVTQLLQKGEISGSLEDHYVTFMASVFRSVRFGASSAHGIANMIRFTFFQERGAIVRNAATGTYRIEMAKMGEAMNALSELILRLQGDGDYDAVAKLVKEKGAIGPELQGDLERLSKLNVPVDIVFDQGLSVLGL
jgi:hypothetical protein